MFPFGIICFPLVLYLCMSVSLPCTRLVSMYATRVTAKHLEDVEVPECFEIYGWTDRAKNAKVIFVNEILRDRITQINQREKSHEYRCIVFMIAVVILHEKIHILPEKVVFLRMKIVIYRRVNRLERPKKIYLRLISL